MPTEMGVTKVPRDFMPATETSGEQKERARRDFSHRALKRFGGPSHHPHHLNGTPADCAHLPIPSTSPPLLAPHPTVQCISKGTPFDAPLNKLCAKIGSGA
jgi:hypothetical protein